MIEREEYEYQNTLTISLTGQFESNEYEGYNILAPSKNKQVETA